MAAVLSGSAETPPGRLFVSALSGACGHALLLFDQTQERINQSLKL